MKHILFLPIIAIIFLLACETKQEESSKKEPKDFVPSKKILVPKDTASYPDMPSFEQKKEGVRALPSPQKPDSIRVLNFDEFNLSFIAKDRWTKSSASDTAKADIKQVYWGLGDIFSKTQFTLAIHDSLVREIEVYQSYQTSMSINDDGAHLDLLDWLHYDSDWAKVNLNSMSFYPLSYNKEESSLFPKVSQQQILEEVIRASGSEENKFTRRVSECKENTYPCSVLISKITIKVRLLMKDKTYKEKTIIFHLPLGC